RKNGHRQQHTILKITAIGAAEKKAKVKKADAAPEAAGAEAPAAQA
ncbi:MAG: 50S ribosomal protein L21, partial [Pseudomonadota bacterium]